MRSSRTARASAPRLCVSKGNEESSKVFSRFSLGPGSKLHADQRPLSAQANRAIVAHGRGSRDAEQVTGGARGTRIGGVCGSKDRSGAHRDVNYSEDCAQPRVLLQHGVSAALGRMHSRGDKVNAVVCKSRRYGEIRSAFE